MAIEFGPKSPTPEPQVIRTKVTIWEPQPQTIKAVVARYEPEEARAVKKGRPNTGRAKLPVTVRLDQDVVKALESREDWRSEVNDVLRRHLGL